MNKPPTKTKRILALISAILLAALYLSTLVLAFIRTELAADLLKVSIFCTIVIPTLLYAYMLIYRVLNKKNKDEPN